jgi:ArsR family transcriptional regulator, arsenate/arsenite/antimonite-responsive transcriptional repressor
LVQEGKVQVKLTLVFKALSDETRQQIICMLGQQDMTAGEIAALFRMAQPSVSHHLGVLRSADLVVPHRQGQRILYSLNGALIEQSFSAFTARLKRGTRSSPARRGRGAEAAASSF